MKALFITTATNDVDGVVSAWDYYNTPAARVAFDHMKPVDDERVFRESRACNPGVIFFIGSVGPHGPSHDVLKRLRGIAPSIHICFDGVEREWHPLLHGYAKHGCFDLQVTIDGALDAPVDLVTVAPVNPAYFDGPAPVRDIRCGFSGNIGLTGKHREIPIDQRGFIVAPLVAEGLVALRERVVTGGLASYPEHVAFMRRCRIIINTSFAGSGVFHHVKQRVWESAFAGCAHLEDEASPIAAWLPPDCYFLYRDGQHAGEVIRTLSDEAIDESAKIREAYVRKHYGPEKIYGGMLEKAKVAL